MTDGGLTSNIIVARLSPTGCRFIPPANRYGYEERSSPIESLGGLELVDDERLSQNMRLTMTLLTALASLVLAYAAVGLAGLLTAGPLLAALTEIVGFVAWAEWGLSMGEGPR